MRCVLGNVSCSAAVLTAQSQTLQQTQADQDHRSSHTNAGVVRQDTHDERGQAHDQDGHQEGVLATDHVAQAAKEDRAKRTHDEAGSKRQQREDEGRAFIQAAEELLRNNCSE